MDRNLLANATSSDDTPTPGYMLNEIAKSTLSSYQANVQIQEYLVARLAKNNYNVKFKCLVIIKHVCRIGRPEFKREMGRNVDAIKECLQYKGPPDPLRGDEIYKRVRDAARETLDAIFDSQMSMTTSAVAAANRIQGLGNNYTPDEVSSKKQGNQGILSSIVSTISSTIKGDGPEDPTYEGHPGAVGYFVRPTASYTSDSTYPGTSNEHSTNSYNSSSSGASSVNGMSGYGNPNFKDAREEKSLLQRASEMSASGLASISSYAASKTGSSSSNATLDAVHRAQNDRDEYQYASNRGPNSVLYNNNTYPLKHPWQQGADPYSSNSGTESSGVSKIGAAASDGEYERKWVQSLCEPGGLKAVPPEDKLVSFMAIVPTLSPETIGSCLVEVFNSEAWQSRTKALAVLFNILNSEDCEVHKQWWIDHKEYLSDMLSDSKVSVRSQAVKTMQLIDRDAVVNVDVKVDVSVSGSSDKRKSPGSSDDTPRQTVPAVAVASLLDSYDLLSDDAPPPAPVASVAGGMGVGGGSLFAGLTVGSASPSSFELPAALPPSNSISPSTGNVGFSAPQVYVPESIAVTPASTSVNLFDNFDSLLDAPLPTVSAHPAVAEPESHGFDFMSKTNANPLSDLSILELNLPPAPLEDALSMLSSSKTSTSAAPSSVMISGKLLSTEIAVNGSSGVSSTSRQESSFTELLQLSGMPSTQQVSSPSYRSSQQLSGQQRLAPATAQYPSQLYTNQQQLYPQPQLQPQPGYNYNLQKQMYNPQQPQVPYYQPQLSPQYGNVPYLQQPQVVNRPGLPMTNSAILPGMLNPMVPRKDIPISDSAGNSGFSFLGSGGAGPRGPAAGHQQKDSFSFVTDEMKFLRK